MGSCQYVRENGSRCGSVTRINFIYFRDAHGIWKGEREVCQSHSDQVFGKLLDEVNRIKVRLNRLQNLKSKVWKKEKGNDPQIKELERYVTDELRLNNKLVSVNSPIELQRQVKEAMVNEVYRRIKKMGELTNNERNKKCRLCKHELNCKCTEQCNNQTNPRHWGETISSATLFSSRLYRRETFNFHIVCGRIFMGMFGLDLLPTKQKQMTLTQSLESLR